MANFISDFFENRGWLGLVQQNTTTGALEVNGSSVTGSVSVTLAQFLVLVLADHPGTTFLISDVPTPYSTVNGVLVEVNAAGTGVRWIQTPSFTLANLPTIAQASGWGRVFVSNLGEDGSYWRSDGTRFWPAQESIVLSNMTTELVLTGSPTVNTTFRQFTIPMIGGKSAWVPGSYMGVKQIVEKTGVVGVVNNLVCIGNTVEVIDNAESNATVTNVAGSLATHIEVGLDHEIRRISATEIKLMSANGQLSKATVGTTRSPTITVSDLDANTTYIDAAGKLASASDTTLTLVMHKITLLYSGVA